MQEVAHFGGVGLGSLELFARTDSMLVIAFAPIGAENVNDALNIGGKRPRLANGLSFLGFEAKPATIETNLLKTKLSHHVLHNNFLPQLVAGGPFEDDTPPFFRTTSDASVRKLAISAVS